jgi:isoleucyl-tRNA synthetase
MENPYILQTKIYGNGLVAFETDLYKGLIYKGYTIQPYSPKLELDYLLTKSISLAPDVTDTTVAQFKTLPETLPSFLQGFGDVHFWLGLQRLGLYHQTPL